MQITVISDLSGITAPIQHNIDGGCNLLEWLIDNYGPDGFYLPTKIFIGTISEQSEIDINNPEEINRFIDDNVFIIHNPLFSGAAFKFALYIIAVIAIAALMPVPELPRGAKTAKNSPNNGLDGQTNIARTLERVPDIFGQVVSYPDLINPTAFEFIDQIKYQDEYVCVGRGFHLVENFRSGNTLISQISGSTVDIFEPGELPTETPKTATSNEVKSQTLFAPNEAGISGGVNYNVTYALAGDLATIITPTGNEWDDFSIGSTIIITDLWANTGATDYNLDGSYVVDSITSTDLVLQIAGVINPNWINFDAVTTNMLDVTNGIILSPRVSNPSEQVVTGPFVVPGEDYSEIWIDIQAPQGIARGKELKKTKEIDSQFLVEEIDEFDVPTGPSFLYPVTVSDNTTDPRFYTFKITSVEGVIIGNRYQISGERLTDFNNENRNAEKIQWTRLASIEYVIPSDQPGTTRARIKTQATDQVASIQERKFNADVTRKVQTWNGSSVVGDINTGVGLVASRRFADCLLTYALDPALGGRTESQIDIAEIYVIQDSLDAEFDGEKGEFSFTFDGKNTPALEEMRQIADSARCFLTRSGSFISIIRDQKQDISRGIFNRRNKKPRSENKTIRYNKPLDHDGIIMEYVDRSDNEAKTINLPVDLPVDDPNYGLPSATNPQKIEGVGIRNYSQAWDRAQYELNRLIYSRVTVETTVSAEGGLLPLNSRIGHVDGTKLSRLTTGGEITAVNGLTITTSERCIFESGKTYSVILRNEDGEATTPIIVTANPATEFGFILSSAPSFSIFIRGDSDYQRGTLYTFGPDGDELNDLYLVQKKEPDGDFYYKLELINYSERYYDADNQTPPSI